MAYTPKDFLDKIIRPTLITTNLHSRAAEQLLLGTAIQESLLVHTEQIGGGPALGYFQMEPATHDDIWENYLKYRKGLSSKVLSVAGEKAGTRPKSILLKSNDSYAAAMARVHYARVPEALPTAGDIKGMATYWKQYYNTPEGKGKVDEFILKWKQFEAGKLFQTEPKEKSSAPAPSARPKEPPKRYYA